MAKSIGQRVTDAIDKSRQVAVGRQGIIIATQFDGSNDRQECQVRWDDVKSNAEWVRGTTTWEMGCELWLLPNQKGDSFSTMRNGFGVRSDEVSPANPTAQVREREASATVEALAFAQASGIGPKVIAARRLESSRQLTLDIRARVRHGAPVKGGANGRAVDPRREGLARAAATGEPMLVSKGPLTKGCTIRPYETDTGISGRIINLTRILTKRERRELKQIKRRGK